MGLRITLLGKGAWGSTLGRLWSLQGHDVMAWSRRDGPLQPTLLVDSSLVVSAVSMAGVESLAQALAGHWPADVPLLSCSKGIDLERLCSASQIWQRHHPKTSMAVLSGPNLAGELDRGLPAASVVASNNVDLAEHLQSFCASARVSPTWAPTPKPPCSVGGSPRWGWFSRPWGARGPPFTGWRG